MKQRVVVQAIIEDEGSILLLRRSQGRPGIVGKLELPGGTLDDNEQPDDGLRRHLKNDVGLAPEAVQLIDAVSLQNREEGDITHMMIVYRVVGINHDTPTHLGQSYDSAIWTKMSELQQDTLRDSAFALLNLYIDPNTHPTSGEISRQHVSNSPKYVLYSDGGSRGNPGPSAAAFVLMDQNQHILEQGGMYLGITTNNQAEYHGVRLGLEKAQEKGIRRLEFRVDSMLVVNQLRGSYKIKNRELWPIYERIRELLESFDHVRFTHVPRELNQLADSLVNKILDQRKNEAPEV